MDENEIKSKSADELYDYLMSEIPSGVISELTARLAEKSPAYVRIDQTELLGMDNEQLKRIYDEQGENYLRDNLTEIIKKQTYYKFAKKSGMGKTFLKNPEATMIGIQIATSAGGYNIDKLIDDEVNNILEKLKG